MKIAVMGPQNTGKSTFVGDFLKKYQNYDTPTETYRDVVRDQQLIINQNSSTDSQKAIRDFLFVQIKTNTKNNIIFDRCVIDNYVYTYVQYEAGMIAKKFVDETYKIMIDGLEYIDTYIFIPAAVSVALVNDTLRDTDKGYIDRVNHHFLRILFELARDKHINIKIVSGTRTERIEQIQKIV